MERWNGGMNGYWMIVRSSVLKRIVNHSIIHTFNQDWLFGVHYLFFEILNNEGTADAMPL